MTHHVTGIFRDKSMAQDAVERLMEAGYKRGEIILADSPEDLRREINMIYDENDHKAMWWGGIRGGLIGAAVLGIATFLFFMGSSEEIFVSIMIVGILVGFTAGNFLGGLAGLGAGEKEASQFVHKIDPSSSVVSVSYSMERPKAMAAEILNRYGATNTLLH